MSDTWTYQTAVKMAVEQEIRMEALHAAARAVDSTTELLGNIGDVSEAVLDLAERFAGWIEDGKRRPAAEEQP